MPDYIIMKVKKEPETKEIIKMKVREVEIRDKHVYREKNGGKSIEYTVKQVIHKMINGDQFFTISKDESSAFSRKIGTKLEYFIRPIPNGKEHTLDEISEYK
jgi:hypothetical protein